MSFVGFDSSSSFTDSTGFIHICSNGSVASDSSTVSNGSTASVSSGGSTGSVGSHISTGSACGSIHFSGF